MSSSHFVCNETLRIGRPDNRRITVTAGNGAAQHATVQRFLSTGRPCLCAIIPCCCTVRDAPRAGLHGRPPAGLLLTHAFVLQYFVPGMATATPDPRPLAAFLAA